MKKKILAVLTALILTIGFSACSTDDSSDDSKSQGTDSNSSLAPDSSVPDSSQPDDSSETPSEPDDSEASVPDSSEDDSSVSVTYMTVEQVTQAFLASLENADLDACYGYCGEDFDIDLTDESFAGLVFDEHNASYQEFSSHDGSTITVGTVTFTVDGKIMSDYAFVTIVAEDKTNVIADISLSVYPTDKLVGMGVSSEDIITPRPEETELGFKNAQALLTVCDDMIIDAVAFGQTVPDGTYRKDDGSDLCDSINANLEYQKITAYNYAILVSEGKASEVSIYDENGKLTEYFKAK